MLKSLILILITVYLTGCSNENEHHLRQNPQLLQSVLEKCANPSVTALNCDSLLPIAKRMNDLAHRLHMNPQAFGNLILKKQVMLGSYYLDLKKEPTSKVIQAKIAHLEEDLTDHLSIVKWLESPGK